MTRTYPRIRVRRNPEGRYDAYLIKSAFTFEIWVSTGPDIAGALWWVKQAPKPAHQIIINVNEGQ